MDTKEELLRLPSSWRYVAVNGNKQPYQKDWQKNPLKRSEILKELISKKAKAVGVLAGELSGGLLFVDHDGESASNILLEWGLSISTLPLTWTVTSGRVGRFQLIYQVPEELWSKIKTKKFRTGVKDEEGSVEQLELRWNGCQSVVAGEHPKTSGYKWVKDRSPDDIPIAEAPAILLERMMETEVKQPEVFNSDYDRCLSLLQSINPSRLDDYDTWVQIGMALHSVGDDRLLTEWDTISAKASNYKSGECFKKWQSFGKRSGVSLGTLVKYAQEDGWTPPPKQINPSIHYKSEDTTKVIPKKLEPINAQELIHLLRNMPNKIRYNTFTHNIEQNEKPLKNTELFYLSLSEQNYKCSKEMAIDCLLKVSHENEFDPVRDYLEVVEKTVEPAYIDRLATTYLRPSDAQYTEPTIYDHMMKATLIGAVRRIFEPGAKHDTATVLMGHQGCGKSTFWKILGGAFFSDSLGDLSNKDDILCLHRSWLCEWSEIDQITSKKHAGTVKSFLSRATDHMRVPYGRSVEEFPRKCIIVGSTNKDNFLLDDTGNRRFHVIPVESTASNMINTNGLEMERDSIWSSAIKSYRNKEPHYLTHTQENLIALENLAYLVESPWTHPIHSWLTDPSNYSKTITCELLLTEAVEKSTDKQTKSDVMTVSSILKSLGYEKKRKRVDGQLKWTWIKSVPTSSER